MNIMAKKELKLGVFTYDIFPYMVTHRIIGSNDNGDMEIARGYFRSFKSMIAMFGGKKAKEVDKAIEDIKMEYQKKEKELRKELRKELTNNLIEKYPELKK